MERMKQHLKPIIITCLIIFVGAISIFQHHVDVQKLSLYSVYVKTVDAESGDIINSTYYSPNYLNSSSNHIENKYIMKLNPHNGSCEIIWIDYKNLKPNIKLTKEGYIDQIIPHSWIRETNNSITMSVGSDNPKIIKMEKIKKQNQGSQ